MADGYGVGLFNSQGPKDFADAIGKIATALSGVESAFDTFGSKATGALGQISDAIDKLVNKTKALSGELSAISMAGGGGGGGGSPQNAGSIPDPNQPGIQTPPRWQWGSQPNPGGGGTGEGPGMDGMQPGLAARENPASQSPGMRSGSANAANPTSMFGRAAESILPAAAGAVTKMAGPGGLMSTAVQGATIGGMEAQPFGVSARSLYVTPKGTLAQGAGDYAQANYYAMMNMGAAPGTQNWSTIQRGANQLMTLSPGMSRQQAMGVQNQMQQASFLNAGISVGLNFRPGGQMQTPQQSYSQIFNRLFMGHKPDAKEFEATMAPGAPGQVNLAMLGIQPGTDAYNGFMQYALTQIGMSKQGKTLDPNVKGSIDLGTKSGAKQTPLGNTPYYSQLQATSAASQDMSQAEPALASAAKQLNDAAGFLLRAVNPLASLLGGGALGGGGLGTLGSLVGTGALAYGGIKLGSRWLGRGGGLTSGIGKMLSSGAVGKIPLVGGLLNKLGGHVSGGGGLLSDMLGGKGDVLQKLYECLCGGGALGDVLGGKGGGLKNSWEKLNKEGGLFDKAKGWMKGGEKGGIRDILGKVLGSDVAKEGEKLGMEGGRGGLKGLMAKLFGTGARGGFSVGPEGEATEMIDRGMLGRLGGGARSMFGKLGGKLGGLRGEGGLLGKAGGLLKGRAGLLGRIGIGGAEAAGEVGGLEAAGTALDATGIGAPVGLALNAAGLALAFHKQIGGLFKDIFKGGLGGGLGKVLGGGLLGGGALGVGAHLLGGLFHHKKKQEGNTDDSSLDGPPPKDSVLAALMCVIKPGDNTVIAALTGKGGPGGGLNAQHPTMQQQRSSLLGMGLSGLSPGMAMGGGILGGLLGGTAIGKSMGQFFGGTPAAAQPGGSQAYQWKYGGSVAAPIALGSLFAVPQTSGGNSANGGGGAASTGGGSGSGSGGTNLSGSGNVAQAYNYFIGKGLKDFQAAGILGNLAQESGVNPSSNQTGGGPGRGIAQWTVDQRWKGVLALAQQRNKPPTDLGVQLDFMWSELTGGYQAALKGVQAATNVNDATTIFEQKYEAAGTPNMANRLKYAGNVLASKGASYARGTQLVARTQLALLHKGESVVPAADNYTTSPYNRGGAASSGGVISLNFSKGSIVLQVPAGSTDTDMTKIAEQFVKAVSKPQVLAAVRST